MSKPHVARAFSSIARAGVLLDAPGAAWGAIPDAVPTVTVPTGGTYVLAGTFAATGVLYAYGSTKTTPAAQVLVTGTAVNDGELKFFSHPSSTTGGGSGGVGATLAVSGALTNNGTILIDGGNYGNPPQGGATLIDTGTLINAGTLEILAAAPADLFGTHGSGGYARIAGTLANSGMLLLQGGTGDNKGGAPAGKAMVTGVLSNTGTVVLNGGTVTYRDDPGTGGFLNIGAGGLLTNAGQIDVQSGQIGAPYYGYFTTTGPSAAGILLDAGMVRNTGTLSVFGGPAQYLDYGLGGQLWVTASGSLENFGVLQVFGGTGGEQTDLTGGTGGTLNNQGLLTNAGSLFIGAAVSAGYRMALPGGGVVNDTGVLVNTGAITVAGSIGFYTLLPARPPAATFSVGGVLLNTGHVTIGGGGTYGGGYAGLGGLLLDTGLVENKGTIALAGGVGGQAAANVGTGATLSVQGVFDNAGLLTLGGGTPWAARPQSGHGGAGAQAIDTGTLVNTGTIILGEGMTGTNRRADRPGYGATLAVFGSLDNIGIITAGTFGSGFGAQISVASGGTLSNEGTIVLNPAYSSDRLVVDGVLENAGTLLLSGAYEYDFGSGQALIGGTLVNTGLIQVSPGFTPFVTNESQGGLLSVSGVLINHGNVLVKGSPYGGYYGSGDGAKLTVSGSLFNDGTITVTGGEYGYSPIATVSGTLNNTGYLALQYIGFSPSVAYDRLGGILVNDGVLINSGTIGEGNTDFAGYGRLVDYGRLVNSGLVNLGGEQIMVGLSGSLTNAGTISSGTSRFGLIADAGVLLNTGTISIAGGMKSPYDASSTPASTIVDSGTLINRGVIGLGAGNVGAAPVAVLSITSTGVLVDTGTISGKGAVENAGTVESASGSSALIAVAQFINDGVVQVAPSSLFFVTGTVLADGSDKGAFDILARGTLEFGGAVASSQEVAFVGQHSTLALGNAALFEGVLEGIRPQTNIDFLGLAVTSAVAAGDTLTIGLAAGGTLDFALADPLAPTTSLRLFSDGHGGTTLHFGMVAGSAGYGLGPASG